MKWNKAIAKGAIPGTKPAGLNPVTLTRNHIRENRLRIRPYMTSDNIIRRHLKMVSRIGMVTVVFMLTVTGIGTTQACVSLQERQGQDTPDRKSYVVGQSAGYLGFIAVGMGWDFRRHQISTLLGYLPGEIGGVEIWQLAFKYEWHPFTDIPLGDLRENIRLNPFYVGLSVIYGLHSDLFVDEPEQYPDGYYPPTALHYTLNVGISLKYGRRTVYVEYAALDTGLIAYVKNPDFFMENYDFFGLEGIGSLAVGIKIKLE